jgi:hypothetical protein
MPQLPARPLRVLAWLIATACSAHAGEDGPTAADPSKLTAGAMLMTDYIYRGLRPLDAPPDVGKHHDACISSESGPFSPVCYDHERSGGGSAPLPHRFPRGPQ